MATTDTPAAATRSTAVRAQGAFAFHASTSCREMRNEANNPEAHGQARKADGEAIALDAVPSPQQAPDDQGHDHDRDGDACRNLQASAVFVPAPLLEDAAQEVSEPAQQAEAARCLHQGQQEKRTRQSRPDQCVGAWQAVVLGSSASNSGPQAEQAGDRQYRDTRDIVRHCSSLLPEQNSKRSDHLIHEPLTMSSRLVGSGEVFWAAVNTQRLALAANRATGAAHRLVNLSADGTSLCAAGIRKDFELASSHVGLRLRIGDLVPS